MTRIALASVFVCAGGWLSHADDKPPPRAVDELSQAAIQSAFQILRSEYIRKDELTFDELNRAALQGLLERLDFGAELVRVDQQVAPPPAGIHSELLTPDIAYIRPQAFAEAEVTQMEAALRDFAGQKVRSLVLDLRSPTAPASFEVAAAMLDFFLPEGVVIFKMKQIGREDAELTLSHAPALWKQPLVVLVDGESCNVGEAMAAVLHQQQRAILVGSATRGGTVRYETVPVDEHWSLRFARAELLLSDDSSIFKKGLKPQFRVELAANVKHTIFKSSLGGSLKEHVFDTARARYNEAALVAGKHPELDAYIRRSAGQKSADEQPPRDTVLQRAVDMLQSSHFLGTSKLEWGGQTKPKAKAASKPEK